MRRFFLALGIGVQDVPRPLPDVPQPMEAAADRLVRGQQARAPPQLPLEQGDRPVRVRVVELLGGAGHQGPQDALRLLEQRRRAATAMTIGQDRRVGVAGEGGGPVVDALPGHPEHRGDVSGGAPTIKFQHGQSPSIGAGVLGRLELSAEATALPGLQLEPAHQDLPEDTGVR
jgi:hypothetical protein